MELIFKSKLKLLHILFYKYINDIMEEFRDYVNFTKTFSKKFIMNQINKS